MGCLVGRLTETAAYEDYADISGYQPCEQSRVRGYGGRQAGYSCRDHG